MDLENFCCLGKIGVDDFLKNYWQQKPLLIKNAFPYFTAGIKAPISADELAGLACEENVNARIVLEKDGDYPWQIEFGPFEESRFSELPESNWSLLVSDVEKHLPETKTLLKYFQFIPDWRVDDLMISYAPEGGSVGAHTDAYDVFLIQLSGQRLWKIAKNYAEETLNNVDLCILKNFIAEDEWSLNAGDMLYLPPNVAHHGIAQDNGEPCLTASVGFRAPSLKTITSDYINYLNENTHGTERYRDNTAKPPAHHAEIDDNTVSRFTDYLKQGLTLDRENISHWLGKYFSDDKTYESEIVEQFLKNYDEIEKIATHNNFIQSPYSHFLFSQNDNKAFLFVNGSSYSVSKFFAETICDDELIDFEKLQSKMKENDKNTFLQLFNAGAIITEK
ncbi:LSU ribosomal protein L16p arginine hydroxylase [hydrothermal vent metagenome]|uniref:LSU ribosomal protein L16p arginine hydroxylase n=1 Tax=hydrothermal vent metagenome TaxID=652676 RepID=A0A3B0W9L6_9ZZZZ